MKRTDIGQFPALGSAVVALAIFGVTLGGTYIYDDHGIILEDPRIANPSRWMELVTGPYSDGADRLYRPLVSLSYAVQWGLHGDRAWAFHLVNLLLHAGASALVAMLGTRLLGLAAGWIAGLIFAVHPVHVEAVANIVGRAELMCATGMLGAMVLLLAPMTIPRALGVAGCFLLSLLSKEQGMLVPLLLAGLWWARREMPQPQPDDRRGARVLVMLLAWLLAGYVIWRESILGFWWDRQFLDWTVNPMVVSPTNPHGGSIGIDRWLMPLVLLGRYVVLLIAPVDLRFDYSGLTIGWQASMNDPYLWLGIAAVVAWCIITACLFRSGNRPGLFLMLGLAMTYVLVGNAIALIGVIFAERLMYIPSIFLVMLLAMMLLKLPQRAGLGLTILLVGLGAVQSLTYAAKFNDEVRFYEMMLARQPESIRLHMMLVDAHRKASRLEQAEDMARRGRELLPEYWEIWWQSGVVALELGKFDEAERFFGEAFRLNADLKIPWWQRELSLRRAAAATRPAG